jgi:hypothetical protein
VLVRYSTPADRIDDQQGLLAAVREEGNGLAVQAGQDGNIVQVVSEDREANRFKVVPKLGFFFNDPSGALRYEVAAAANYDKRLGQGTYLNSAFKLNLLENVSGVTQPRTACCRTCAPTSPSTSAAAASSSTACCSTST